MVNAHCYAGFQPRGMHIEALPLSYHPIHPFNHGSDNFTTIGVFPSAVRISTKCFLKSPLRTDPAETFEDKIV